MEKNIPLVCYAHLNILETYVEEAEHLRHSYNIKQIYAKEKQGMR
nr:hypothetical protein [Lysinibacillus fusiformis]